MQHQQESARRHCRGVGKEHQTLMGKWSTSTSAGNSCERRSAMILLNGNKHKY